MEYIEALESGSKKIPVVGTHEQDFVPWRWFTMLWHFTVVAGRVWSPTVMILTWILTCFVINCGKWTRIHALFLYYLTSKYWRMYTLLREQTWICCRSFIFLGNFCRLYLTFHVSVRAELQKSRGMNADGATIILSPSFEIYWRSSVSKTFALVVLLREDCSQNSCQAFSL